MITPIERTLFVGWKAPASVPKRAGMVKSALARPHALQDESRVTG